VVAAAVVADVNRLQADIWATAKVRRQLEQYFLESLIELHTVGGKEIQIQTTRAIANNLLGTFSEFREVSDGSN
jgi:hypothetical protein